MNERVPMSPPTPVPPTSRSPVPTAPTLRTRAVQAQLAEVLEPLRSIGEKCAPGCPGCRDIAGLPERNGLPAVASKRQPHLHENPADHRRNCPGVEAWGQLARLLFA